MALTTRLEDLCFFHVQFEGGVLIEKIICLKKLILEMQDVDAVCFRVENKEDLFIIGKAHLQLKDFLMNVLEDCDVCRNRRIMQG